MPELAGLLLAAGGSSRLGQPKQLVDVDGQPLVCRQAALLASVCDAAIAVLGAHGEHISPLLEDSALTVVENPDWQSGMASSLRTGIRALPNSSAGVMILLCDQYRLLAADLRRLADAWREHPDCMVAARWCKGHGAPAIFPRSHFSRFDGLRGDRGARALLSGPEAQASFIELPRAEHDLDTREDLSTLARR